MLVFVDARSVDTEKRVGKPVSGRKSEIAEVSVDDEERNE